MALSPMYGYDPATTNTGGFYGFRQDAGRQYPVWLSSGTQARRPVYDTTQVLPAAPAAPVAAQPVAPPPQPEMMMGWQGAEGAGAGGDFAPTANQPAPGYLADVLSGLGLSTGMYGGPAGSDGGIGDFGGALGSGDMTGMADTGTAAGGDMTGVGGMYHGGIVTRNKLKGPNPPGPDDGHVAMDLGEGVLTAKAVKHYGPGIVARLNKLQVPKEAFSKR